MRRVKSFWIGHKCTKARLGAEVNRPAAIFGARKILRVGVVENPPAESREARRPGLDQFAGHAFIVLLPERLRKRR